MDSNSLTDVKRYLKTLKWLHLNFNNVIKSLTFVLFFSLSTVVIASHLVIVLKDTVLNNGIFNFSESLKIIISAQSLGEKILYIQL